MPAPHSWRDCYPAVIDRTTGKYTPNDDINVAVRGYFKTLTHRERLLFHEACCHHSTTSLHMEVIDKVVPEVRKIEEQIFRASL